MKIVNIKEKKILDEISIFLNKEEAEQLISYLEELIKNPSFQHSHLSSEDYQTEITTWVYCKENIKDLPKTVQKLLKESKWE